MSHKLNITVRPRPRKKLERGARQNTRCEVPCLGPGAKCDQGPWATQMKIAGLTRPRKSEHAAWPQSLQEAVTATQTPASAEKQQSPATVTAHNMQEQLSSGAKPAPEWEITELGLHARHELRCTHGARQSSQPSWLPKCALHSIAKLRSRGTLHGNRHAAGLSVAKSWQHRQNADKAGEVKAIAQQTHDVVYAMQLHKAQLQSAEGGMPNICDRSDEEGVRHSWPRHTRLISS